MACYKLVFLLPEMELSDISWEFLYSIVSGISSCAPALGFWINTDSEGHSQHRFHLSGFMGNGYNIH